MPARHVQALLAACGLYGLLLAIACVVPNAGAWRGGRRLRARVPPQRWLQAGAVQDVVWPRLPPAQPSPRACCPPRPCRRAPHHCRLVCPHCALHPALQAAGALPGCAVWRCGCTGRTAARPSCRPCRRPGRPAAGGPPALASPSGRQAGSPTHASEPLPQTFVKNAVVATTIAAAPVAGALAAGAAGPGLRAVVAPAAYLFMSILHREILMDIQVGGWSWAPWSMRGWVTGAGGHSGRPGMCWVWMAGARQ